jgi:hypothetical protein
MDVASQEDHTIAVLAERHGDCSGDTISRLVDDAFDGFDSAPIRSFVPVLVQRQVDLRLKDLAASQKPGAPTSMPTPADHRQLRFVRAIVIDPGAQAAPRLDLGPTDLAVLDQLRRRGRHVVLLSQHPTAQLRRHAADHLLHVDAVIAGGGATAQVGAGSQRPGPEPVSPRSALLQVLHELDIDPHDVALVHGPDTDPDLLSLPEFTVATQPTRVRDGAPLPGRLGCALRMLASAILAERTEPSRGVTDSPAQRPAQAVAVRPMSRDRVNIFFRADEAAPWQLGRLLRGWLRAHYECVVIDVAGGHDPDLEHWLPPGARTDVSVLRGDDLTDLLHAHPACLVLDCSRLAGRARSEAITAALSVVGAERARTGRPHWLIIDGAEQVLRDPDIPPHALDLATPGHCMILRTAADLPAAIAGSLDVTIARRLTGPTPIRTGAGEPALAHR